MAQNELQTFQLSTPLQLMQKFAWGINQLRRALESADKASSFFPSVYMAFDCSITAWHMCDWVWGFYSGKVALPLSTDPKLVRAEPFKKFQARVREQSNCLRICMHIANSNKHFGVDRHPDPSLKTPVEHSVIPSFTAGSTAGSPLAYHAYSLMVIDGVAKHDILDVLSGAFSFWADFINEPSLMELLDG
ncbi:MULTISPECIES: hypothetical protein [Pseudomonas syringae group genomosp. 2]|uniref:hypothetical protein n=1 Tax=Pseudomonas syringae group genomosp. 2 TaxID=251698 RepID=UPI00128D90C8|nr:MULTISPECIES: hypothetical protein [Pseudomonas syringae group genomosp. 2]QOI06223.1 hypothetical protein D5S10_21560 [Pseudomonas savastanoi]